MSNKIIIGFGCKRLRGKDTAAIMLVDILRERDHDVRFDAFALTLKDVCRLVFGFTDDQVNTPEGKAAQDPFWGFTPRWALQTVGTEAFRQQIDHDVWVKVLQRRYQQHPQSVVVTDVRFRNEVDMIKSMGGYVIRVDRDIPFEDDKDHHASECSLDDFSGWDYVVSNNSTLDLLDLQLKNIVNGLADAGRL